MRKKKKITLFEVFHSHGCLTECLRQAYVAEDPVEIKRAYNELWILERTMENKFGKEVLEKLGYEPRTTTKA